MVRLILILLMFTICHYVEGSRKGRKELLDAISLIMAEARQVKHYEERTADVDLGESEPHLEELKHSNSVEFGMTGELGSVEFEVGETCTTTRVEIQTREECKQVTELECKPVVRFRTEIRNRCTTLVDQNCEVVFKDEPERKCLATEEEHCHTAYKRVEENHYKEECHTDIQNICEEQIRIPVEVPYPVRVPYPVYPKVLPHPSKQPTHPHYEQYPIKPKTVVTTKSPNNFKPTDSSSTVAPLLSEFYLIIPETEAELNRSPKSLVGEPDGEESAEQPVYAYNPAPTPQNSPLTDFIRKLDSTRMERRRREVDNEGSTGPPGFPGLIFNKTVPKNYSKILNKPSTFVRELPAPPGCRSIVTKTCRKVPFTVAHNVAYEKCEMVPGVKCHLELEKVAQLECVPVVEEECNDIAKKVPYQDEEQECEEVIYDECVEIEEQVPIVECMNIHPEPAVRLRSRNVGRKHRRKPKLEPQRSQGESTLMSDGYA